MPADPLTILWLAPFVPYPLNHGGAVRIYNMLRWLGRFCVVDLVALSDVKVEDDALAPLRATCRSVQVVIRPSRRRQLPGRIAPPAVYLDDVEEMHRAVASLQVSAPHDVLQIEYPSLSTYLLHRGRSATFLTELDVTFLTLYRRFLAELPALSAARRLLAAASFFYYELRNLPRYDGVIAMSEYDSSALKRWVRGARISVIANGVDCDFFTPQSPASGSRIVLFVGNFRHPPNVDAVLYLAREIWPMLFERLPDARLLIVGANATPQVRALDGRGIEVLGYVTDVRECYSRAGAVVVPLRYGSGTRIKMLEAFAMGVPVVSTSMGIEGIEAKPERHFLLADSSQAFVAQITRLLGHPDLSDTLRRNARQLVQERYDWSILAGKQMELYERTLLSKRRA